MDELTVRGSRTDRDADFEAYVSASQTRHLRTAFLLTGDQHLAEDLLQTALAKLYLAWHRVASRESLDAYVRRIMVNENTSWHRRAWKRRETVVDVVPEHSNPADPYRMFDQRDRLWPLVQRLPARQRAAVVLRYYEDLSERDTAAILNCSVGTVKSQTSRAIATLRTAYEEVSER